LVYFAALSTSLYAQISIGGKPYSFTHGLSANKLVAVTMPGIDLQKLQQEDEADKLTGQPPRFGHAIEANLNLNNSGKWQTLPDGGRLWRLSIQAPGAKSINLLYNDFYLPQGAVFYIYSADGKHVIGGFTSQNNKSDRVFATGLVYSDHIILEYYEPKERPEKKLERETDEKPSISINYVVHGYRHIQMDKDDLEKAFDDSGNCNVNTICSQGDNWRDQIKSVAMMLVGGTRWCTGYLVNNTAQDCRALFLTANHCLASFDAVTNPNANTFSFVWRYESPNCTPDTDGPLNMTTSGATVLANPGSPGDVISSDFALLELAESPKTAGYDVYFAGFDATTTPPSAATGIHHPSGDVKKISMENDALTATDYGGSAGTPTHWRVGDWDSGTTEGGSSGSPIFSNATKRAMGFLSGGGAACGNNLPDWYGQMGYSWTNNGAVDDRRRLNVHLDPVGEGTTTFVDGSANPCASSCVMTQTFSGTLTLDDPTYNRVLKGTELGGCSNSGVGTNVHYDAYTFTLVSTANVLISVDPADGGSLSPLSGDTYLTLYGTGGFNPAAPCSNAIVAHDDIAGASNRRSRIQTTIPLAPGTYTFVFTSFDNIPSGGQALPWTYSIVVTSAGLCETAACDLEISNVSTTPEGCPGANNGSITVTATSSNGPITYAITGPANQSNGTGIFTNLPDGNYNITVTDDDACEETSSATVAAGTDNTPPMVTQGTIAACYATVAAAEAAALAATSATDNCPGMLTETASTLGTCTAVVTVTTMDANGNSTPVTYNTRIDNTAPMVTTGSIAACYPTVAAAEAAALAATSATDNCPGTLTETASTVGTCSATITVTTTDGCGNSTPVTYNTRIDNTAPMVTTGSIAACYPTVAAAEAAALAATSATDNCPGTLTETASTVGTCSATITVTTTDGCGNSTPVTYNTRIDNTPPTLVCRTGTVLLDGNGNYTLQAADVFNAGSSFDNCPGALTVTNISPASVSCNQVNQTIPVVVTVQDGCGNTATCTAMITVQESTALPAGWSSNNVGNANGSAGFKPCTGNGEFTVTAVGFSTSSSDVLHLASRQLCGNGEIIARLASVNNAGWGGIMLRESLAQGSKMVALKAQGNGNIRRMIRTMTNGPVNNLNYSRPQHDWLRLTRNGSTFVGYTSMDGVNWTFAFSANVSMTGCLYAGLFAESINGTVTTTAAFDNVSITGSILPLLTPGSSLAETAAPDFQVYPNPTTGEVNLDLSSYINRAVRLELYDAQGRAVKIVEIEAVESNAERLDLSQYQSGLYLIRVQSEGLPDATKRVVLH